MQNEEYMNIVPEIIYFVNRKCTPSWSIVKSNIDFHDLTYVYSGRSVYIIDGIEYKLQQGDLIYIPVGSVREAYTSSAEPMQCYAANFCISTPGAGQDGIILPFGKIMKTGISGELVNLYSQLDHTWVEKSYNYRMRAKAMFMLILDRLLNLSASGTQAFREDVRLQKVKKYILQNYADRIDINHLADIAGLNPVYLGAYFKKANGCTIKQYITRLRINNAESLLSTGGYSVGEAAMRSGFDDYFYFSKVYKAYKGYAPSALLKDKTR